jgi:hypothetical protein
MALSLSPFIGNKFRHSADSAASVSTWCPLAATWARAPLGDRGNGRIEQDR